MPQTNELKPGAAIEAAVLTLVAGYIDAIGFIRLGGTYVANMSGNSVAIGIHSAQLSWPDVSEKLLPVLAYVVGLIGSRMIVDWGAAYDARRAAIPSLALEVILLVAFMSVHGRLAGIALAALAMGIQVAAVTRFNKVTVYTAFVTGSLVKFADSLSEWIISLTRHDEDPHDRVLAKKDAIWFLSVWIAYVAGAIGGSVAYFTAGVKVTIWACVTIGGVIVFTLVHPQEAPKQGRRHLPGKGSQPRVT